MYSIKCSLDVDVDQAANGAIEACVSCNSWYSPYNKRRLFRALRWNINYRPLLKCEVGKAASLIHHLLPITILLRVDLLANKQKYITRAWALEHTSLVNVDMEGTMWDPTITITTSSVITALFFNRTHLFLYRHSFLKDSFKVCRDHLDCLFTEVL